jgi:ArsR family transcriptional regulator, arsenate/arsenite/antimonite-responsive transcriptional repressor
MKMNVKATPGQCCSAASTTIAGNGNADCRGTARGWVDEKRSELTEGVRLFKALADETRLTILKQLRDEEEVCACDLVACCDVAQPTVSHHLKVLREAGLVLSDKRGLWVYYRLDPTGVERLRALIP